jgi:isoleucyl-tRNA synthetase
LVGNLTDFDPSQDGVSYGDMLELDRWALHKFQELIKSVLRSYEQYEYHAIYQAIYNFCVLTLSSFYLDVLKDRLYTTASDSRERRSAQTVMNEILEGLVRLVAPIIPFTAEEVWAYLPNQGRPPSVHAAQFGFARDDYLDTSLIERWNLLLGVRKEITKALELARQDKVIGHSLDASVTIALSPELLKLLQDYRNELRSICIVSAVEFVDEGAVEKGYESQDYPGLVIGVAPSQYLKCERCWVRDPAVGQDAKHPTLCDRCTQVIKEIAAEP